MFLVEREVLDLKGRNGVQGWPYRRARSSLRSSVHVGWVGVCTLGVAVRARLRLLGALPPFDTGFYAPADPLTFLRAS
jgi:hypothetical protein